MDDRPFVVKLLRSPVHAGRLARLDIDAARAVPGVVDVISAADVPGNGLGWDATQPVLAGCEVCYRGELIAAVAAANETAACQALDKLRVAIDASPQIVLDLQQAWEADSIFSFDGEKSYILSRGDVQSALRSADAIVEGETCCPAVGRAPLPQEASASPTPDGGVAVQTSGITVLPVHHSALCGVARIHAGQLSWQTVPAASDLAGDHIFEAYIVALLALRTQRPVAWQCSAAESAQFDPPAGAWSIHIRDGVTHEGRILARQIRVLRDAGAYVAHNHNVVTRCVMMCSAAYDIPNVHLQGYCLATNRAPAPSLQELGAAACTFAVEAQMERIARTLALDPWRVRMLNAHRTGGRIPTGGVLDSVALIEVIQKLAQVTRTSLPADLLALTSDNGGQL